MLSMATTTAPVSDVQLAEFMRDLNDAIQKGRFKPPVPEQDTGQSAAYSTAKEAPSVPGLANVHNLSNQTFSYIVNWLKQQQKPATSDKRVS